MEMILKQVVALIMMVLISKWVPLDGHFPFHLKHVEFIL